MALFLNMQKSRFSHDAAHMYLGREQQRANETAHTCEPIHFVVNLIPVEVSTKCILSYSSRLISAMILCIYKE